MSPKSYWFYWCLVLTFLAAAASVTAVRSASDPGRLLLTVAYCPTYFSGAGAVVEVDLNSGQWHIAHRFSWPSEVFGCPALYDPSVHTDAQGHLFLDFLDAFGFVTELDLATGTVIGEYTPHPSDDDDIFDGFINFVDMPEPGDSSNATVLRGLTPHVEPKNHPYCSDGCLAYEQMNARGEIRNVTDLPFKETSDDAALYVPASGSTSARYYTMVGYDLRDPPCGPSRASECLLSMDADTGEIISTTFSNYTVYKFARAPDAENTVLTWMYGFERECRHNYAFAKLDLSTGKPTLQACIPPSTVVDFDEWIADFSLDNSLLATASGDSEGDPSQLIVFDTSDGSVHLQTDLRGLGLALGSRGQLVFVWSVDFVANMNGKS